MWTTTDKDLEYATILLHFLVLIIFFKLERTWTFLLKRYFVFIISTAYWSRTGTWHEIWTQNRGTMLALFYAGIHEKSVFKILYSNKGLRLSILKMLYIKPNDTFFKYIKRQRMIWNIFNCGELWPRGFVCNRTARKIFINFRNKQKILATTINSWI